MRYDGLASIRLRQKARVFQEHLRGRADTGQDDGGSGPSSDVGKGGNTIELVGKQVRVNPDMAIFITMNPGYAGRSNLPDNLKKLFRSLAMTKPGAVLIAEVMLFSQVRSLSLDQIFHLIAIRGLFALQGFSLAEKLSKKIVPLFKLCKEQLSPQGHYDFGLRALKVSLCVCVC